MTRQITDRNGRIPAAEMTTVGTDYYGRPARFLTPAAASWQRMLAAGMPWEDGGRDSVSDTYRDLARQRDYFANPPNGQGLAARPGTSWHGEGLAVDTRGNTLTWLAQHGDEHGWVRTIDPEPWHFEYFAERDQHRNDQEDDDMGNLDPKQIIRVSGEAAKALGSDEITLGGFVGLAAADYRQNRRDNAKLLTEVQALRRSLGQPVDEKELAERVVEQLTDDLQDAVKEALAGTNVDPDLIAKKTADMLAKRLAS